MIFAAPKAGDIHKLHFALGTVTTGDTLIGSLQNVSLTTGDADGTPDQSGTVVVADGDDNAWKSVTLGADRTVTKGELVAFVIGFNSFVAGNLNILVATQNLNGFTPPDHFISSAWQNVVRSNILVVEYADGSFAPATAMIPGVPSQTVHGSNTTPDEIGNIFRVPFACQVSGFVYHGRVNADADFILYDSDGSTALATISQDADVRNSTAEVSAAKPFPSDISLLANTWYRLVCKPTTTTTVRMSMITASDAAHLAQLRAGTEMYGTKRTDAGAWTEEPTVRYALAPVISAVETGGSARPRMVVE